ncbi:protein bicaudal C homolog 1-A [Sinocyclocheilus grahami]|uniref:protein bicaudal C homolog 1-A n=1 Tax=Sinocyclocheilus grahami TaxID=75366 RepID=UPI0007ACAA95|nr:PREDICTED: protein bicaudal C homolog 1 [Sinocyclocheilus grahami]
MAAQCEPLSGYLQQSDPGSNSERSADSPLPVSEDDSSGPTAPPDPEWTEERFRVDRKKLEIMLLAATEGRVNGGEDFFQKVMEETDTQIAWPSKLKIGAKSKKDPHIKVSGKRDNVKEAKEKIMSVLDTKSNRVTLKMDVSHTEHSHVIGKGGNNIKKVMEDTGCHIHFPDSNRNNQAEKSNQVSIAGQPGGVEAARARIRELLPLVLMFELPVIVQLNPDPSSPAIQHISQTYNISVAFKQRSRLYGATGVVRGSQNNAAAVKRGTAVLLEHLTGNLASAITVSTQLDIAPQHHLFMMGRNGSNIKHIMQRAGAQVHFPDPNCPQKKSTVYVQGTIDSVCLARQYLMELLPLVLMFELPVIVQLNPDPSSPAIQHISQTYNISVAFKQRSRLYGATGVVRGSQNNAAAVKRGTAVLLEHLTGNLASAITVSTQLDIAPQHHLFMMGRNGSNIKHIMQRAGAQVHFPDPNCPQKKSTVYVQGTIDSVCLARQYLMGCLPLVLMFDIKEDIEVEPQCITSLMEQLDVFISVKPKPKQPSKRPNVLIIPTLDEFLDSFSHSVFSESEHSLLGPMTASMTGPSTNSLLNALNSSISPLQTSTSGTPSPNLWPNSLASPASTSGFSSPLMIHPATQATLTSILLSGVPSYTQNTPSPPPGLAPIDAQVNRVSDCSKAVSPLSSKQPSTMYSRMSLADKVLTAAHGDSVQEASPHCPSEPLSSKSSQDRGSDTFVEVGMPRSPSHSGNSNELKQMLTSCKTTSGKRQALELLQGTKHSLLHSDCLLSDSDSSASESPVADKRAPGSERAAERAALQNSDRIRLPPQSSFSSMQAFDYEQKKLLATKAMLKKPVVTEVRTPTNTWSGLGFSKSMPAETIKELRRANHVSYKPTMSTTYEGSPLALSRSNSREGVASGSDSDNWRERNGSGLPVHSDFPSPISPKRKQNKTEHYLSSSNYMDCISSVMGTNGCNLNTSFKGSDLPELFSKLGLGKYTDVFQQQEIDLQTFLTLTDQDLKELGITTFGARRKMLLAISELNKNRRKLFEPPNIRSSFLEGGASGRLPRQFHTDIASVSGRW